MSQGTLCLVIKQIKLVADECRQTPSRGMPLQKIATCTT